MPKKPKPLSANKQHQLNEEMRHVAMLLKEVPSFHRQKYEHFVVEGNKVKIASWNTDYHNGDIDDYKERDPKPGELLSSIPYIEAAFKEKAWKEFHEKIGAEALAAFYDRSGIPHSGV